MRKIDKLAGKLSKNAHIRIATSQSLDHITDETIMVGPELAEELLSKNKNNRPINWDQVERYAEMMRRGEWKLHPQGIIIGADGNLQTGQQRLWAIIAAGVHVPMRISRGSSPETAKLIDRGRPQSASDLATRTTGRKHSPTEISIARAIAVLRDMGAKISKDELSAILIQNQINLKEIMMKTRGVRKSKASLMILAALCEQSKVFLLLDRLNQLEAELIEELQPDVADKCWNKGTAFRFALTKAQGIVWRQK